MGTLRFSDVGREEGESWVPNLDDWECTQWQSWHLFFLAWSWGALNLPVPSSSSPVWTCFCCPVSSFPFYFLSPHLSPPLALWVFPYCAAWLSSGFFCGGEPHLCRSCEGWQCRFLCWHHWWVMTTILTGSTDWSFETLQLLQLEKKKTKEDCSGNIAEVSSYIVCEFLTNICVGNPVATLSDWSEVRKWWKRCHRRVFWYSTPLRSSLEAS